MLDAIFQPVFTDSFTVGGYLVCTLTALALGALIAFTAGYKARASRSLGLCVLLLPTVVQTVIMMVNGNLGTGVAVAGAFSLIRFRSAPGSARELVCIFSAMAVGLATAGGYLGVAVVFTLIVCAVVLLLSCRRNGTGETLERELRLTVPESLNFAHSFDDLFEKYTEHAEFVSAKTTNMGSLYRLHYRLTLKDDQQSQAFLDELRCRNGNLEVALGVAEDGREGASL